ncbi:polysaccharide deacetylase family protein [Patescibacteria group bacterium]|nr:polysaccharide deacetylase family protein [Patescibacteria group bacterium]
MLKSCYLPLLRILSKKSGFGLTINVSGSLIAQLKKLKEDEFFDLLKKLSSEGKIEIISSAMYHPLIPITQKDTVIRQIKKNNQILKNVLGCGRTNGFFPPELAVDSRSLDLIDSKYILVDETSIDKKLKIQDSIVKYGKKYLLVNNRKVCEIMRAHRRELFAKKVADLVLRNTDKAGLIVTANDAEIFGHHFSERLHLLADLLDSKEIKFIKAADAVAKFGNQATTISGVKASTWDINQGFSLWNKNVLQKKYLKLLQSIYRFASESLNDTAVNFFDEGNSSCYLFWLSNWPWWHPGLADEGATQLMKCIRSLPVPGKEKIRIEKIYFDLLKDMWQYHWLGKAKIKYKEHYEKILAPKEK